MSISVIVRTSDFSSRIIACWQRSAEAFIETGRLLAEAKAALPHGEFLIMVERELPFDRRVAQMLMKIAADNRLTNASVVSLLPPHYSSLYELTKLDDQSFKARVADGTIRPTMERKDITQVMKRERRDERERDLGARICAMPQEKYGIIYADPPWRFDVWSRDTGLEKSPDQHYPTMTVDEICALPVCNLVPEDAILFLWITVPLLDRMTEIFRAWGRVVRDDPEYGVIREPWKYVSNFCWDKEHPSTGRWNRNQHEHLLIARVGDVPAPSPSDLMRSIYREAAGKHSAKPEYFAALIERHFPDVPKIELFRRGPARPGWAAWGNEAVQVAA